MLTGLSESLGCKTETKKKIPNNPIHSHCDILNNLGNHDLHEIVIRMILTSSNTLETYKIIEYMGLVTGESLIGANIYKDLFSGVRDVVGGRTSRYEEELEKARDIAFKSMEEKAEQLGANAIVGLKISYNNLGGTLGNTILVTAYGTAVKCE
jgi:uncharacterized protein YbjQ (UPF0145 family)